ncbi:MAG: hypothetical protein ACK5KQ_00945 [Anaerorhabdus sp.]
MKKLKIICTLAVVSILTSVNADVKSGLENWGSYNYGEGIVMVDDEVRVKHSTTVRCKANNIFCEATAKIKEKSDDKYIKEYTRTIDDVEVFLIQNASQSHFHDHSGGFYARKEK